VTLCFDSLRLRGRFLAASRDEAVPAGRYEKSGLVVGQELPVEAIDRPVEATRGPPSSALSSMPQAAPQGCGPGCPTETVHTAAERNTTLTSLIL
jgi:hypothetical protein